MQRVIFTVAVVFVGFLMETVLANILGPWVKPNFLIIIIVFFNLFRGIRYSLLAAVIAGLLKDSFGIKPFGLNIFSFVLCAYLTTFIKWYIYTVGSKASRVLMVFLISTMNVLIHYALYLMYYYISFREVLIFIMIPEVILTTLLTYYVFETLLRCAIRYSV